MMSRYDIPANLRALLVGGSLHRVSSGESGTRVFRIIRSGGSACYLKIADALWQREELLAEKERLEWLQGRLPVPEVYAFSVENGRSFLLLSEIPGQESCDAMFKR